MAAYPSCAIEQAREVIANRNFFPSICVLSDLAKRGIPLKKKIELIRKLFDGSTISEDSFVQVALGLEYEYVKGTKQLSEDQVRLGLGPDRRYRHEEFLVGKFLETVFHRRFFRYPSNDFDFVSYDGTYDVLGPVPPYYFNQQGFLDSFGEHIIKQGLDHIVACTVLLPKSFQKDFALMVQNLPLEDRERILVIDEKFCDGVSV